MSAQLLHEDLQRLFDRGEICHALREPDILVEPARDDVLKPSTQSGGVNVP